MWFAGISFLVNVCKNNEAACNQIINYLNFQIYTANLFIYLRGKNNEDKIIECEFGIPLEGSDDRLNDNPGFNAADEVTGPPRTRLFITI